MSARARGAILLVLGACSSVRDARADEGDTCVLSYEQAQVARKRGDMVGAKAEITLCQHACPTALSKDCDAWAPEVQAGIGALHVRVRRSDGLPATGAALVVDGVDTPLGDGTIEVNPGGHQLRLDAPGMVTASIGANATGGATTNVDIVLRPRPVDVDKKASPRPLPVAPFVVGGVGLGVIAAGGVLGIIGQVDVANMRATCGKEAQCSPARVDTVRKEWIAGGALAGIGGGAVVVGVVLLFADRASTTRSATTFLPIVDVGERGASFGFRGAFE